MLQKIESRQLGVVPNAVFIRVSCLLMALFISSTAYSQDTRTAAEKLVAQVRSKEKNPPRPDLYLEQNRESEEAFLKSIGINFQTELKKARILAELGPFSFESGAIARMNMPEEYLLSVLEQGFLNIQQTGHTEGSVNKPEQRAYWDDFHLRTRLEDRYNGRKSNPVHYMRSKSTILDISAIPIIEAGETKPSYFRSRTIGDQFGGLIVVFKDRVLKRSLWTVGVSDGIIGSSSQGNPKSYTVYHKMYDKLLDASFIEAMVFGELDLRDVNEFWVTEGVRPETLLALKKVGLPVFQYDVVKERGQYRGHDSRQERPLIEGDPEKMALLDKPAVEFWTDFLKKNYRYATGLKKSSSGSTSACQTMFD